MKFKIESWSFLLILCFFKINCQRLNAETIFPETQPTTKTEKIYSEANILGKEIYTVNVFPNQSYFVYIALDTSTMVKLPYPIDRDFDLAASDVIKVTHTKGENFFFIKPSRENSEGIKTNLHAFCKNNFHVLLNIEIVPKQKANKQVNILDGASELEKAAYTKDTFWAMRRELEDRIGQKSGAIENLLYAESIRCPLDNSLTVNETKIRLKNLTLVQNRLYYSLEWDNGLDPDFTDVSLYLTDFENRILSEIKSGRTLYSPTEVIHYPNNQTGFHRATIVFEVNGHKDTFYSTLIINKSKLIFEDTVNLALLHIKNESMFRNDF